MKKDLAYFAINIALLGLFLWASIPLWILFLLLSLYFYVRLIRRLLGAPRQKAGAVPPRKGRAPKPSAGEQGKDVLEKLTATPPTLLADFRVVGEVPSPETWNWGREFVTRQIACACGSPALRVATRQSAAAPGVGKQEAVTRLPPVYLSCPRCGRRALLFDAALHGWNGQVAPGGRAAEARGLVPFRESVGEVLVTCSYQGIENYQELFEDGISDPQDYFDTFTVYYREPGQAGFESVVSCECA